MWGQWAGPARQRAAPNPRPVSRSVVGRARVPPPPAREKPVYGSQRGKNLDELLKTMQKLERETSSPPKAYAACSKATRKSRHAFLDAAFLLQGISTEEDKAVFSSEYFSKKVETKDFAGLYKKILETNGQIYNSLPQGSHAPYVAHFRRAFGKQLTYDDLRLHKWKVAPNTYKKAGKIEGEIPFSIGTGGRKSFEAKYPGFEEHLKRFLKDKSRESPNRTCKAGEDRVGVRFLEQNWVRTYLSFVAECKDLGLPVCSFSTFRKSIPSYYRKPKKEQDKCDTCATLADVEVEILRLLKRLGCLPQCPHELPDRADPEAHCQDFRKTLAGTLSELPEPEDPDSESFDGVISFSRTVQAIFQHVQRLCSEADEDVTCCEDENHKSDFLLLIKLLNDRQPLLEHKRAATRQRAAFYRAQKNLKVGECMCVGDYKENFSLKHGLKEKSFFYHGRPQRNCLGFVVIWRDENGELRYKYVDFICRKIDKSANFVFEAILQMVKFPWFTWNQISFWFDRGKTHFWNKEMSRFLFKNLMEMGYVVDTNYFLGGHGKSRVDGHFGFLMRSKEAYETQNYITSTEQLVEALREGVRIANEKKELENAKKPDKDKERLLDVVIINFELDATQFRKVKEKLRIKNFEVYNRFRRTPDGLECYLFSNSKLCKTIPFKDQKPGLSKRNTWKEGFKDLVVKRDETKIKTKRAESDLRKELLPKSQPSKYSENAPPQSFKRTTTPPLRYVPDPLSPNTLDLTQGGDLPELQIPEGLQKALSKGKKPCKKSKKTKSKPRIPLAPLFPSPSPFPLPNLNSASSALSRLLPSRETIANAISRSLPRSSRRQSSSRSSPAPSPSPRFPSPLFTFPSPRTPRSLRVPFRLPSPASSSPLSSPHSRSSRSPVPGTFPPSPSPLSFPPSRSSLSPAPSSSSSSSSSSSLARPPSSSSSSSSFSPPPSPSPPSSPSLSFTRRSTRKKKRKKFFGDDDSD